MYTVHVDGGHGCNKWTEIAIVRQVQTIREFMALMATYRTVYITDTDVHMYALIYIV